MARSTYLPENLAPSQAGRKLELAAGLCILSHGDRHATAYQPASDSDGGATQTESARHPAAQPGRGGLFGGNKVAL